MNFDIHDKWMQEAYRLAIKSYDCDEVPVGCVIIKDNKIIGRGHNEVERLTDSTAHAEMIAITSASNYSNDWRLTNTSIYVTKEPCIMCYGAILNSRIENLYYGVEDPKLGFRVNIVSLNPLNFHLKNIQSGVLDERCKSILKDFFINKRKNNKIK
jgi:tRNA(adenine34) deaminase